MTHEIDELVGPTRTGLIYEKEDLLAPVPEGALEAPTHGRGDRGRRLLPR